MGSTGWPRWGESFPPNTPLLYGLSDARVNNPMAPAEYVDRLKPILAGWWGEIPVLKYQGKKDTRTYRTWECATC